MKHKLLLFIMTLMMWNVQAVAQINRVRVVRFTDISFSKIQYEEVFLLSNGQIKDGSFSLTCSTVPFSGGFVDIFFSYPSCPKINSAVLASISGKPVTPLENYKSLLNDGRFRDKIIHSNGTYPIDRVPYVIIGMKPKVTVSSVDPFASETAGDSGQFMISLNAPSVFHTRVKFIVTGNAKKGRDFQGFPNSLIIPAGNVSSIIEILPLDDSEKEGTEKVTLKLAHEGIRGYTIGRGGAVNVSILDND